VLHNLGLIVKPQKVSEVTLLSLTLSGSLPLLFKQLKTNLPSVVQNLKDREISDVDVAHVVSLYDKHQSRMVHAQNLRRERNLIADAIKSEPSRVAEFKDKVLLWKGEAGQMKRREGREGKEGEGREKDVRVL
jgi:seryl-tRNA synthetase